MSADIRHAHRCPPESTICSRNSGTSGTPISAICFRIMWVAIAVMPGQAAESLRHVGGGVAEHGELQVAPCATW